MPTGFRVNFTEIDEFPGYLGVLGMLQIASSPTHTGDGIQLVVLPGPKFETETFFPRRPPISGAVHLTLDKQPKETISTDLMTTQPNK